MNDNVEVIKTGGRDEQRRQQLVMALLQQPSLEKAAKSVGISAVTAWRICKTPAFLDEYRQARREAFGQAMARLQQASSAAVSTLLTVMADPQKPAAVRVRAAECVLQHATNSFVSEELAARVDALGLWMRQKIEEQEMPPQKELVSE
jgi:hypothetical protein